MLRHHLLLLVVNVHAYVFAILVARSGRFSVVKGALHLKERSKYAVKVVENKSLGDEENLEALETEIAILRKLDHPHIVALKEVVVTRLDTFIVMELLSGGELFNRIVEQGRFNEKSAAALFAQILLSMEYLHSLNIVHRDVKPENILYVKEGSSEVRFIRGPGGGDRCCHCRVFLLLCSPPSHCHAHVGLQIKLIDFGYAGVWEASKQLTGLCGTPDYVAPEVLTWYEDDENGTPYGKGSDLWSLGVLLYVILSGCSPFSADEEEAILQLVNEGKYEFHESEWSEVSAPAKDLISKLLVVDPEQRLTMEGMLEHGWLKEAVAEGRASIMDKTKARLSTDALPKAAAPRQPTNDTIAVPGYQEAEVVTKIEGDTRKRGGCACVIS